MGEINVPTEEQNALMAIDPARLAKLIEQCLDHRQADPLRVLQLERCGEYVGSKLYWFQESLSAYSTAKAARKVAETERDASRDGRDLERAVREMQYRVEKERQEGQLFYIDDLIGPPSRFSERVEVRVTYRWRPTIEAGWQYGDITFIHDVDLRPDYSRPLPKRKPSAAQQERDKQGKLFHEWDHLRRLGLQSLKEFFQSGGTAMSVPESFQAKADSRTRGLNNFSAKFWSVQTAPIAHT